MPISRQRKIFLSIFLSIQFCLSIIDISLAQNAKIDPQVYQSKIIELKNRRDTEIAALIKQRDAQMVALQQQMKNMVESDIAQFKKDKAQIEQKIKQGKNMNGPQQLLIQQERAMVQKSNAFQQQINKIKLTYDQQIQKIVQAYSQMFNNMQKQMVAGQ